VRLSSDQEIAGHPVLRVRALLRRFNQDFWTIKTVASVLRIPGGPARRLVYALRRLGYVEAVPDQRPGTWRNTISGNALANATAAAPISRPDADRVLREFLMRVGVVNSDPSALYRVGMVVVFGSYLKPQQLIGDIDLAIRLDGRPECAECWSEALLARAEVAANQGRHFRSFLDRLAWAETEVKRYLRGGVRGLSLHDWTKEAAWLQHASHKVLLADDSCAAVKSATQGQRGSRRGFRQDDSDVSPTA